MATAMTLDQAADHDPQAPSPSESLANRMAVRKSIDQGARLDAPYLIMNTLATVVAAYGLLSNSPAVVIGAMIIALLLGPIMGLALALVDGDVGLLRRALVAEVAGVALVLAIGITLGRIHLDLPITAEILARTRPNLLDLAIALAGGAAGAYATVSPRVSVGLVGVAISTALVPPLTACGICLSRGLTEPAAGAFVLFLTNLVAIQCASSALLFGFGFHRITDRKTGDRSFYRRLAVDAGLFLSLSVFLYFQLASTIQQQQFEESAKAGIERGINPIPGAQLAETFFRDIDGTDVVVAVVRAPQSITPAQTAAIEAILPARRDRRVELHIRSLLTKETTASGYRHVTDPSARPAEEIEPPDDSLGQGPDRPLSSPAVPAQSPVTTRPPTAPR